MLNLIQSVPTTAPVSLNFFELDRVVTRAPKSLIQATEQAKCHTKSFGSNSQTENKKTTQKGEKSLNL